MDVNVWVCIWVVCVCVRWGCGCGCEEAAAEREQLAHRRRRLRKGQLCCIRAPCTETGCLCSCAGRRPWAERSRRRAGWAPPAVTLCCSRHTRHCWRPPLAPHLHCQRLLRLGHGLRAVRPSAGQQRRHLSLHVGLWAVLRRQGSGGGDARDGCRAGLRGKMSVGRRWEGSRAWSQQLSMVSILCGHKGAPTRPAWPAAQSESRRARRGPGGERGPRSAKRRQGTCCTAGPGEGPAAKPAVAPDLSAVKRMVGASRLALTIGSHFAASFLLSSYLQREPAVG